MSTVIEEFVAKLGWDVDSSQLKTFTAQAKGLKDFALTGARYVRNFAAGFIAFTTATAMAHTRLAKMAAVSGFATETLEALDDSLSGTGLSFDTLVKASTRFGAIMGDIKTGSASQEVADGFRAIGLAAKDLEKLSPEEQFTKTADAIISADDAQKAMSASTALFGQRAAVVIGHYRSLGKSVSELIADYRKQSMVDDESRRGTMAFADALLQTKDIFTGMARYMAGITGSVFAPYLETLNNWVILNKELVKTKIKDFVRGVATALKWLLSLAGQIKDMVRSVGGLGNAFKLFFGILLGVKLVPFLASLNGILKVSGGLGPALATAGKSLLKTWGPIGALFSLIYLLVDDILVSLRGGKSLGGWIDETAGISKWLHELPTLLGVPVDKLDVFYQKLMDLSPIFSEGLASGFSTLFDLGMAEVMRFVYGIGQGIQQVFGMLVDGIKGLI
ncbi:MAG TPA: hypothetical protein VJ553_00890, partial [Candidatus Paceibacterota bacterium]|nr:hypothetical protein [Candidatus Paceibacterota bacterium]